MGSPSDSIKKQIWVQEGFEDFIKGSFGNGGQNIYVSRAGIIQRIHRFDLNCDGYADLVFCNAQDFNERPPIYVVRNPLSSPEISKLPTLGTYAGVVGDLNNDGYDDLVLGNQCNGTHPDLTAYIYYGSPEGWNERYKWELPAPNCRGVAIGDFNGDGRPDLAFASDGKLRIFYQQEKGFIPDSFIDHDIYVTHLTAEDLDGDGYAELYIRTRKDPPQVLWGGSDGIDLGRSTVVGGPIDESEELPSSTAGWMTFAEGWAPRVVRIMGVPYLFRSEDSQAVFYPVNSDRTLGEPMKLDVSDAVSAASGDINNNGLEDIVIAVCKDINEPISSWIYWGSSEGYHSRNRTPIQTLSARDMIITDLDGNGYAEVVVCQGRTDVSNDTESLVFLGAPEGINPEPLRFVTHDATGVLAAHPDNEELPKLVVINHVTGRVKGDVPIYIYYNGPDGFSEDRRRELLGWSSTGSMCCDFNDDGWPDILVYNCGENAPDVDAGSYIYWGGREGFDQNRQLVVPAFHQIGGTVGDFRHSGYLDIVSGGYISSELLIFRGTADGFDLENPEHILMDPNLEKDVRYNNLKELAALYETPGREWRDMREILSADFNNDGWLDLFVSQISSQYGLILWGGPDGFSMERSTLLPIEASNRVLAADLTGNGWLDLIVGGFYAYSKKWAFDSNLYIYWGGPDGFSTDRCCTLPGHHIDAMTVADFNNDGVPDIYIGSYNAGRDRDSDSYIYWGMPGGRYSVENRSRLFGHSSCGCMSVDFNEDGWIDLAVGHHKTYGNHVGQSKIWWNGPDGFDAKRVTKLPTRGPHGMLSMLPRNIIGHGYSCLGWSHVRGPISPG